MFFKRRSKQEPLPELKPLLKKTEKKKPKGSRWSIVILFVLTLLASLFFYLKTEAPKIWERITAPLVISTFPEE